MWEPRRRFPLQTIADKIIRLSDSASEKEFITYEEAYGRPFDDMMRRVPCLERIQETVGYDPKTSLDQILEEVISEKRALLQDG